MKISRIRALGGRVARPYRSTSFSAFTARDHRELDHRNVPGPNGCVTRMNLHLSADEPSVASGVRVETIR